MKLTALSLTNYKNITAASYQFDARINCFIGKNGVGKSNVLDAIYHLCFGKGYFNPLPFKIFNLRKNSFTEGTFEREEREEKIVAA